MIINIQKRLAITLAAFATAAVSFFCMAAFSANSASAASSDSSNVVSVTADSAVSEPVAPSRISIKDGELTLKYLSYAYTGERVYPDAWQTAEGKTANFVTVTVDGKKLVRGRDYKLVYANNIRPGTAKIAAVGIGNYTGTIYSTFIVRPAANTVRSLSTGNGIRVYYRKNIYSDGYQIIYSKDKDFKTYHNKIISDVNTTCADITCIPQPGETYYVKVRSFVLIDGKRYGDYSEAKSLLVRGKIGSVSIPQSQYTYTGQTIKPSVTVKDTKGKKLTLNKDYTYTIVNAYHAGTATIKVVCKNNYMGTIVKTFKILPADISKAAITNVNAAYSYTGNDIKPAPKLTYRSKIVGKSTGYTVSYSNNKSIGTATITIKGTNDFTGTTKKTFKIAFTGWDTDNGWKVYYDLGKKATGMTDIGSDTYFFDSNGRMQTGWQEIDGNYFCFDRLSGKLVKDTTINKIEVDKTGKAVSLTDYGKQRIATMMHAHQIMLEQTKPTDTMEEKRLKLFIWEYSTHPYKQWRLIKNYYLWTDEWDVMFANDIFVRGRGCCVADACAAAFLFVEIGYTEVWVANDDIHGWVVMNGRVFDPLFAEARNFNTYYNATGSDYLVKPRYKIRID